MLADTRARIKIIIKVITSFVFTVIRSKTSSSLFKTVACDIILY